MTEPNETGDLHYERFTLKTRIIRFFRNVDGAWWLIRNGRK